MTHRTVYIAGPMTGLPEHNYPAFNAAADHYRAQGHTVHNPAENTPTVRIDTMTWTDWVRLGIAQLVQCDTIVMLDGWSRSNGACLEIHIARSLNMRIRYQDPTHYGTGYPSLGGTP